MSIENNADKQYLSLVREILDSNKNADGTYNFESTRTKFRAIKVFGKTLEFDLSDGTVPILTTKRIFWRSAVKELIWIYVLGSNRVSEVGSKIWDSWAKEDGTIGPAYGHQARHLFDHHSGKEIDQVAIVLDKLRNNPTDRGMVINLWNVADLPHMSLRPCAFMTMWDVKDGHLNCTLVQRSADVPVGVPFNFFQYSVLLHMFAHISNLKPGKFLHVMNNAHIYENQIEPIMTQLQRTHYPAPKLVIDPNVKNWDYFNIDHFNLIEYQSHPTIDMGEVAI